MNSRLLTAILVAGCLTTNGASAADETTDTGLLDDPGTTILTAEREVQWTPHATTVLTRETLEQTYRPDLEHVESLVPGLIVDRMNRTPRGAAIAIRGLGSAVPAKGFDPAVAVSIDGVYVGTHASRLQVLFDFDRVEVRRGPQGVQDSNPNLSGSVNFERSRPTGELDVDLRASVGTDKRREADAVINFPVVDSVNAKLAMYWKERGGDYMTNVFSGRDENTEDYAIVSASISWDLEDWFDLVYTFDHENSDETTPALLNISAETDLLCATTALSPFPNCRRGTGNPELDSLRTTAQNFSNDRNLTGDYHTLRLDFNIGNHQVRSITGLRETDERANIDMDASNADFYHVSQRQEYHQFSQEFTVSADYSENLSYRFGAYFLNTDYDIFQQEFHILKQLGDAGLTEGHAAGEIQELTSSQNSDLRSVFVHVDYILNEQWSADIGGRWTEVERDFEHIPSRIRLGDNVAPIRTLLEGQESTKQFLWLGGLSYQVDEEAMIYFRYAEGFLPGGFDENAMSAIAGNSYGAETTRSVEIGLKSDWWADRLRVNLAYFDMQLDNKVERFNAFTTDGQIESLLDNVAEVEVSGWEIEFESIPLENLYLRGAYSRNDADYQKYAVANLAAPGTFLSLDGLQPSRAPKNNLFFSASYSFPAGPGRVHTYAGYRLLGDYQTNPLIPEADVKNWSSWDLSVSYEYKEWLFRLFSNNVKNKEFIQNVDRISQTDILPVTSGISVPTLITLTEYNQPRYTGIEIIYRPEF